MRVILDLEFNILNSERLNEVMKFAASVRDDIKLSIDFRHKLANTELECKSILLLNLISNSEIRDFEISIWAQQKLRN